jgi:hypothetical protein
LKIFLSLVFIALITISISPSQVSAQGGDRTQQTLAFLDQYHIPPELFVPVRNALISGDYTGLQATLAQGGVPATDIQAFMTPENMTTAKLALSPNQGAEILLQAAQVVGAYGIDQQGLMALLPVANDPVGLMQALTARGLSAEQITQLAGQLAPIIQQANESGTLQYASTLVADQTLQQLGSFTNSTFMRMIDWSVTDPAQMAAQILEANQKLGVTLTDEQVQQLVGVVGNFQQQGMSNDTWTGNLATQSLYALQGLGLPSSALLDLSAMVDSTDPENRGAAVRAYLESQGLSGAALELAYAQLSPAFDNLDGLNLTPERLTQFQETELGGLAQLTTMDPEQLSEFLASDPETQREMLAETGMTEDQINQALITIGQTTLGQIGPDALDFVEGTYEPAFDDEILSDDSSDDDVTDDSADDDASIDDDSADDETVDDSGDDSSTDDGEDSVEDTSTEDTSTEGGDSGGESE